MKYMEAARAIDGVKVRTEHKGVAVAVKEFVELAGRCCSHFSSEYIKNSNVGVSIS